MTDDLSFTMPSTSMRDTRPAIAREGSPLFHRKRRCDICDRPGPFRSPVSKRCVTCESAPDPHKDLYQKIYSVARGIAVNQLIKRHRDEYNRLFDDAWPTARERVIKRVAAEAEVAERRLSTSRRAYRERDALSHLPRQVKRQLRRIADHEPGVPDVSDDQDPGSAD